LIFQRQRTALIKAAGQFSRSDRDELARRKRWCKERTNVKWRSEIEQLAKKLESDLLGNRLYGKLLAAELENKRNLELETQDNAMFAKLTLLKCIILRHHVGLW
jgi:hypothetical protein